MTNLEIELVRAIEKMRAYPSPTRIHCARKAEYSSCPAVSIKEDKTSRKKQRIVHTQDIQYGYLVIYNHLPSERMFRRLSHETNKRTYSCSQLLGLIRKADNGCCWLDKNR